MLRSKSIETEYLATVSSMLSYFWGMFIFFIKITFLNEFASPGGTNKLAGSWT